MKVHGIALPARKPGHRVGRAVGGGPKTIRARALISSGGRYREVEKALALPKTKLPMVEDDA